MTVFMMMTNRRRQRPISRSVAPFTIITATAILVSLTAHGVRGATSAAFHCHESLSSPPLFRQFESIHSKGLSSCSVPIPKPTAAASTVSSTTTRLYTVTDPDLLLQQQFTTMNELDDEVMLSSSSRSRGRPSPTQTSSTAMALTDGILLEYPSYRSRKFQGNDDYDDEYDLEMTSAAMDAMNPNRMTVVQSTMDNDDDEDDEGVVDNITDASTTASSATVQFKTSRKRRYKRVGMKMMSSATTTSNTKTMNGATPEGTAASGIGIGPDLDNGDSTAVPPTSRKMFSSHKSSTMPGLGSRSMTGRERAYRDGVRLADFRSGSNRLTKLVDSAEYRKARVKRTGEAMYINSASVPDSLVKFAREIHGEDRITPSEELELGQKTQAALQLQSLYDTLVSKLNREPTDEEWCAAAGKINMEAIRQTIQDGIDAKNKLVTANLRMVQACVNLYIRNGLGGQYNAGDMMQEGIMALIRAAEKYEPDRGFRFSTYALYWIRSAVKRSQMYQSRVITVPHRMHEIHKRVSRANQELRITLRREPTSQELCNAVGMSSLQLERCMEAVSQRCYSLDQQLVNRYKPNQTSSRSKSNVGGSVSTMLDLVDATRSDDGEYKLQKRTFLKEDLIETMKRYLTEDELNLLLLRFGMEEHDTLSAGGGVAPLENQKYSFGTKSIAEVSDITGLKPDKVRRTIERSLKYLKEAIGNDWKDFERELP